MTEHLKAVDIKWNQIPKTYTFSAQIDTYGRTRRAIFSVDITRLNINISATKLLPALQAIKK